MDLVDLSDDDGEGGSAPRAQAAVPPVPADSPGMDTSSTVTTAAAAVAGAEDGSAAATPPPAPHSGEIECIDLE